jgi:hypothetical protein
MSYLESMSLSDREIQALSALVDRSRAPDSPAALDALKVALASRYIPASDLTIHAGEATRPLHGHVLAHSSSVVYTYIDKLWPALHGGGVHGSRVFGDLSNDGAYLRAVAAFRDPKLVREMRTVDTPQASIGERLVLCLRALGSSSTASTLPYVFRSVQRHLSELLLAHPVLLHPKVLVPIDRGGNTEYMSVLHALAHTGAGLPRRSHFVGATCGLKPPARGDDVEAQLRAFECHPCVRLALRVQTSVHVALGEGNPQKQRAIVMRPTRLIKSAFAFPAPRVQFLASLMEMQVVAGREPTLPLVKPTPDAALQTSDNPDRKSLLQAIALSMFAASGMIHTPATGTKPLVLGSSETYPPGVADATAVADVDRAVSWRHHPADAAFHQCLKAMAPVLLREPEYVKAVREGMTRRLFLGRFDEIGVEDVRMNAEALLSGLVRSGFVETALDAGACAVTSILGPDRPGGGLPKAEVQAAAEFLSVIESTGALGTPDTPQLQNITDAVTTFPDHSVPFRENWVRALTVFGNARVMRAAFERNRSIAPVALANSPTELPVVTESRRRRLSV